MIVVYSYALHVLPYAWTPFAINILLYEWDGLSVCQYDFHARYIV